MVVLQKLGKALVHSGDIMLNIQYVSLRWERGDCIHVMVFLGGGVMWLNRQCAWLRARRPGFDPGCWRGGDFLRSFVSRLLLEFTQPTIK